MRVGIIGTGAISHKHAVAYRNLGTPIVACTNATHSRGREFATTYGTHFVESVEELCRNPEIDFIDLCTLPCYRLQVLELCALHRKHVLVQKPIATDLITAARMIELADQAGIQLGVVSQHRFDDSFLFLKKAIDEGRLGRILQADAYVKWWRSADYYSRPIKGSWAGEGGGALMNQGIHQVDLLLYLAGPVSRVAGMWQLGAVHSIESEDSLQALLRYESGATGVIQASTAFWPGAPERIEIHGTKGTAIVTGDVLTTWQVPVDHGEPPPLGGHTASGMSDPLAISTKPLERQISEFMDACSRNARPLCSGQDGYRALELVQRIYASCADDSPAANATRERTPAETDPSSHSLSFQSPKL
jgi:UDP-N-acetyl-2-amino-2-deoxyglucuronate dehydrogenase